jgi:hypothetical protein
MAKYYAYGLTSKGETKLFVDLSDTRAKAENEAKEWCKSEKLTFQYVKAVNGTQYNGQSQHKSLFKRIAAERSKK